MASLDFEGRVDAMEIADGTYVVSAHGPLDARIAGTLRDVLVPLAAADGAAVYLDLGDAHGLDDEALAIVSVAAHLARRRDGQLALLIKSQTLLELVQESGLDRVVRIFETLGEAMAG